MLPGLPSEVVRLREEKRIDTVAVIFAGEEAQVVCAYETNVVQRMRKGARKYVLHDVFSIANTLIVFLCSTPYGVSRRA